MKHLLIACAALASSFVALPAMAQDEDVLDVVGAVIAGLAEGEVIGVNGANLVVTRSAPGAFAAGEEGADPLVTLTVTGDDSCVFDVAFTMQDQPPATLRFNANVVSAVNYELLAEDEVNRYQINLVTDDEAAMQIINGDQMQPAGKSSPMQSSLSLEELNEAAAALKEACPGTAG